VAELQMDNVQNFIRSGGYFSPAAAVMADLARRTANAESPELSLAMALTVQAVLQGNVCIKLPDMADQLLCGNEQSLRLPGLQKWIDSLAAPSCSEVVAWAENSDQAKIARSLLVIDKNFCCYLQRHWLLECSIVQSLLDRSEILLPLPEMPAGKLHDLVSFFPDAAQHPAVDHQQLAVLAALRRKLFILSGGPGTGKTTVAAAILAMKLEQNPQLRIKLAAPTAKAAARLLESVQNNLKFINICQAVKDQMLALESCTIHRLLGFRSRSHEFICNRNNPLDCDLLLVDECSMVPQQLMARMLEALPPEADLILLGDRYQLASVEAGSVMADICRAAIPNSVDKELSEIFTVQTSWQLPEMPDGEVLPLNGCLIELSENHRFDKSARNIGNAATLIRNLSHNTSMCRDAAQQIAAMQGNDFEFITDTAGIRRKLQQKLRQARLASGESFMDLAVLAASGHADDRAKAFALLAAFKLLAPAIKGPLGTEALNTMCMEILDMHDLHDVGMPLIITINDYNAELFNSDIGLIGLDKNGEKRVYFAPDDPGFTIAELPEHKAVFAMTVHKSQGSGFGEVVFVMPEGNCELMTREMVYTAMTRAEKHLCMFGSVETMTQALSNVTCRTSNLYRRLSGN